MTRIKNCKFCNGKVELRQWMQKQKGELVPIGVYEYYACAKCGHTYSKMEVESDTKVR